MNWTDINMTKYVEWDEPFDLEGKVNTVCRVKVDEIIVWQRAQLENINSDFKYDSDEQALQDFVALHWGWVVEE